SLSWRAHRMTKAPAVTTRKRPGLQNQAYGSKIGTVNLDSASKRNDEVDWDTFDSTWYRSHNYGKVRPEDREIVQRIRDFFAESFADNPPPTGARGLDVGPGSNLYPSLAMLPFCDHLDLWEHSAANVRWLRRQQRWWHRFDRRWNGFWRLFSENATYR